MGIPQQNIAQQAGHTIDEIYALPEGKHAELINGQIYMMAAPGRTHQQIVLALSRQIADYIDKKGGGCEVYIAPFAVFLNADDKTYVEPDISVICDREKLDEKGCNGAPDWIIEIVPPGNPSLDYLIKLNLYMNAGVREYWLVDYQKNRIIVYSFEQSEVYEYTFQESVKAGIYEDLEINFPNQNE